MVKRKSSTGELISTLVFFFAGVWLVLEGKSMIENQEMIKGVIVSVGGILSFLAAFRFRIQKFFDDRRD